MKIKSLLTTQMVFSLLLFTSCQREEKSEEKAIDRLVEESKGSFPNTMEKTRELEEEVKKANLQIQQESQERVNQINEELKKKKH